MRPLNDALVTLKLKRYWAATPKDDKGNPRGDGEWIDRSSFDPTAIRGLAPPEMGTPEADTLIPIAINNKSGGYSWIKVKFSTLIYLNRLVVPEQRCFFSVMLDNHPQHLVIDLDGSVDAWPLLVDQEEAVNDALRGWFADFYQLQFGKTADTSMWRADKVPAPEEGPRSKTSLHVNHPGCAFRTARDMHEFMLRFVRWIVGTHPDSTLVSEKARAAVAVGVDIELTTATPIDLTVYNSYRNMRCAFSRKAGRGKLPLMPMDPSTDCVDALWSSLTSYSMSADPSDWHGFDDHTEVSAISPEGKAKAKAVKRSLERGASSGEPATKPPRVERAGEHDAAGDPGRALTYPPTTPADLELLVASLNVEKRLLGEHDAWRNVVWAIKGACPDEVGYAIAEKWTVGGKPGSTRPSVLLKTWRSGKTNSFNVGSLWKWLKEDLAPDAYRALSARINPPAAVEEAAKARTETAQAIISRATRRWREMFGKAAEGPQDGSESHGKHLYEARTDLPHSEIMAWYSQIPRKEIELVVKEGLEMELMKDTVLPMCNIYWKFLKEKKQDRIFVKQGCVVPDDDRLFRWLEMDERRFRGAAHCFFKLPGMHAPNHNVAHVWLAWVGRETYNGPACVPPTARPEQKPHPFQFNEWVALKVSHERARRYGDPTHQDWLDFRHYLMDVFLQGEPDVAVKKYLAKWLISQYVRPGWKLKVALVLFSELNQVGKTELCKLLRTLLLGETAGVECQSEDALDKFNELIAGKLLVCLEEFVRCKAYNERLKVEITADTHNINGKNDKVYTEPNCANHIITTNNPDAVDVFAFDRRVFIVRVLDGINTVLKSTDADGNETSFDYSQWKGRKWDSVHLAAGMLAWAKELDLDNWDPTDIPVTEGAKLQRVAGEEQHDPVAAWWRKFVTNKTRAGEVSWDAWNSTAALYKLFLADYEDNKKLLGGMSSDSFIQQFGRRGFAKGSRFITNDMRSKASFKPDQQNAQAFKLPTREMALKMLDSKVRAGKVEDEESPAATP